MSISGGRLSPPAIFSRPVFERLLSVQGDTGARDLFQSLEGGVTVPLDAAYGFDIDTEQDLHLAEKSHDG
jgi:CTP:molybdopterin cytidylyltransferase MocA